MIKQEIVRLGSRYIDGSPIFLGEYLLTWVRTPHMPW